MLLRSDATRVYPTFLRWLVKGPEWWRQVETYINVGAVFTSLKCADIPKFKLTIPPLSEQLRISGCLASIDDKIAVNRHINQTLEAMAQAIFKSWFVDFDPVKAKIAAKQEGRDPLRAAMSAISGLSACNAQADKPDAELDALPPEHYEQLAATAALFPDEMEDAAQGSANAAGAGSARAASELGETNSPGANLDAGTGGPQGGGRESRRIPKGWAVEPLGLLAECLGGATPDTKNPDFWEPGEYAWTTPKDLSGANSPVLLSTERKLSKKGLEKVSSGLLPIGTLLMSSRAPIGYLSISQIPIVVNQGYIAMPPGGKLPPLYLYFWCKENLESIKGNANGSTFLEISKKAFRPILALKPSDELLGEFMKRVEPLFSRIVVNEKESADLKNLRDILLPKLLSGELSVENRSSEPEVTP